ncbi:MAG: IS91 family transposase, partial [Sulfitobacter sp.]|nr:IS91 family transposase [Sulfitobacter sp.]
MRLELADILRTHGPAHLANHTLIPVQEQALRDIVECRTAAFGGHLYRCDNCAFERPEYNSCDNRHCPKCQTRRKEQWLEARRAELLPVEYFHLVFTLDHRINPLAIGRPRVIYGMLFRCVADTLLAFARNPKWLGATPGILMFLHTWGQKLDLHIHAHCIVTGGGLTEEGAWRSSKPHFLFPVNTLSEVFRAKFLDSLRRALANNEVRLPKSETGVESIAEFIQSCKEHDWVVYAKGSYANPEGILDYLGRYTFKTAISNERLVEQNAKRVRFRYRDHADGNKKKTLPLEPPEFIRRFVLHILPKRFMRVRGYGLLANRDRKKHLQKARAALGQFEAPEPKKEKPESVEAFMLRVAGVDIRLCPR